MIGDFHPLHLLPHVAGLVGAVCYVGNYVRLTFGLTSADRPDYFATNLFAASLVLYSLFYAFNPAGLVIQSFFILVSAFGLGSSLRRRSLRHLQSGAGRTRPSPR